MAFDNFVSPPLPVPPKEYNFDYFNQLIRMLSSYLRIHDSRAPMNTSIFTCDMLRNSIQNVSLTDATINPLSAPLSSFIRIASSEANSVSLQGISNGSDGRYLALFNAVPTLNITLVNNSNDSDESNRFLTCTGENITLTGYGVANMVYSIKDARWIILSVNT